MSETLFETEEKKKPSHTPEQIQDLLYAKPPPTVAEREALISWLDSIKLTVTNIFYAILPKDVWESAEKATGETSISVELCGVQEDDGPLPKGLYLIDIPSELDNKYRDPLALAFVHFGKPPEGVDLIPVIMSVVLPKPTAHEQVSAKMFLRKFVKDNENNTDVLEWAEKLI